MQGERCPVCGGKAIIGKLGFAADISVTCDVCGIYYASNGYLDIIDDRYASYLFYYKTRYSFKNGYCCFIGNKIIYSTYKKLYPNIKLLDKDEVDKWFPGTFFEKIDLILHALGTMAKYEGQPFHLSNGEILSMFFTDRKENNAAEMNQQCQIYLDYLQNHDLLINSGDAFILQPKGLMRSRLPLQEKHCNEEKKDMIQNAKMNKLNELINRGEEVKKDYHPFDASKSSTSFEAWMGEISIFNERHLKKHPLHDNIHSTYFLHKKIHSLVMKCWDS